MANPGTSSPAASDGQIALGLAQHGADIVVAARNEQKTAAVVWKDTERTAYIIDETPAGRLGEPEDLAGAGIFLASAASDFVTGTSLRPAGGSGVGDKLWPRP